MGASSSTLGTPTLTPCVMVRVTVRDRIRDGASVRVSVRVSARVGAHIHVRVRILVLGGGGISSGGAAGQLAQLGGWCDLGCSRRDLG